MIEMHLSPKKVFKFIKNMDCLKVDQKLEINYLKMLHYLFYHITYMMLEIDTF